MTGKELEQEVEKFCKKKYHDFQEDCKNEYNEKKQRLIEGVKKRIKKGKVCENNKLVSAASNAITMGAKFGSAAA